MLIVFSFVNDCIKLIIIIMVIFTALENLLFLQIINTKVVRVDKIFVLTCIIIIFMVRQ